MKLFVTPADLERNAKKAQKIGSSLDRLAKVIPWESFRPVLEEAIKKYREIHKINIKSKAGRPAFDLVLMFKICILQRIYNISDAQMEFQILDRLSFQRFLGLDLADGVPDEKTIRHFKNQLATARAGKDVFDIFNEYLINHQMILEGGVIVDASFIEKPHQHFTKDEKASLDQENEPEEWKKPEAKAKVRQKDTDAKWTKKHGKSYFGYKNHVKVNSDSKLIMDYLVTNAAVHDSQAIDDLITKKDAGNTLYADAAYAGMPSMIQTLFSDVGYQVHERAYRNNPLTEEQKARNKEKSRIRSRVEHVFAFMENSMNRMYLRTIGQSRTEFSVGLMNLVYNFFRFEYLQRA